MKKRKVYRKLLLALSLSAFIAAALLLALVVGALKRNEESRRRRAEAQKEQIITIMEEEIGSEGENSKARKGDSTGTGEVWEEYPGGLGENENGESNSEGSDGQEAEETSENENPGTEKAALTLPAGTGNPQYCTIWPIKDLEVYDTPMIWRAPAETQTEPQTQAGAKKLGSVPAGKTLCVLKEEGDCFQVMYDGPSRTGYIDKRYCMINLTEYLGSRLSYRITNSYDSIFRVQDYELSGVTHTVIPGFEKIALDPDNEVFVVPYLYPCANRLIGAIEKAEAEGYRFRIYESFRPRKATRFLYDTVGAMLEEPVTGGETTYREAMTQNTYKLSAFLAKSISAHNRGIALDLTLVDSGTGEELAMQSPLHDLSWRSVTARNNENAKLLEKYMKGEGFAGLNSEWWHFQDDLTKEELSLSQYLEEGVSLEGFTADEGGVRYRLSDGSILKSTETELGGRSYRFDPDGYCTEQ